MQNLNISPFFKKSHTLKATRGYYHIIWAKTKMHNLFLPCLSLLFHIKRQSRVQVWAPHSQKYLIMPHRKFIILRGSRDYMQEHLY